MKKLLSIAVVFVSLLAGAGSALALQPTSTSSTDGSPVVQQITLTGIVPLMRVIYIDQAGKIVKVLGNTDQNITPEVSWNDNHQKAPLTPAIENQYQAILTANNNRLEAGKTYYPPRPTLIKGTTSAFTARLFGINLLNLTSI